MCEACPEMINHNEISEAQAERLIDAIVMRTLATDRAYLYAEDAEQQAWREQIITAQAMQDVYSRFDVR